MTKSLPVAEIVALAFGEIDQSSGFVVTEFWVRTFNAGGSLVIGKRDPALLHVDVIAGLLGYQEVLVAQLGSAEREGDTFPSPAEMLPAWNSGPLLTSPGAFAFFVDSMGYTELDKERGAALLSISLRPVSRVACDDPKYSQASEYWLARHSFGSFHDALRRVLDKMAKVGLGPTRTLH